MAHVINECTVRNEGAFVAFVYHKHFKSSHSAGYCHTSEVRMRWIEDIKKQNNLSHCDYSNCDKQNNQQFRSIHPFLSSFKFDSLMQLSLSESYNLREL